MYSRSHVQQSGGEPEGFPRVSLSPLIFVLSLLAKTITFPTFSVPWSIPLPLQWPLTLFRPGAVHVCGDGRPDRSPGFPI
jgi:hypothetical protein